VLRNLAINKDYCQIKPHIRNKLHVRLNAKLKWNLKKKQIKQNEIKSVGEPCVSSFHLGFAK
jgi:hypothetical protein